MEKGYRTVAGKDGIDDDFIRWVNAEKKGDQQGKSTRAICNPIMRQPTGREGKQRGNQKGECTKAHQRKSGKLAPFPLEKAGGNARNHQILRTKNTNQNKKKGEMVRQAKKLHRTSAVRQKDSQKSSPQGQRAARPAGQRLVGGGTEKSQVTLMPGEMPTTTKKKKTKTFYYGSPHNCRGKKSRGSKCQCQRKGSPNDRRSEKKRILEEGSLTGGGEKGGSDTTLRKKSGQRTRKNTQKKAKRGGGGSRALPANGGEGGTQGEKCQEAWRVSFEGSGEGKKRGKGYNNVHRKGSKRRRHEGRTSLPGRKRPKEAGLYSRGVFKEEKGGGRCRMTLERG